jgi:cytochrome c oxidase subunit 2
MGHHSNWPEWIYVGVIIALMVWVGAEAWNVERLVEHVPADAETIIVIVSTDVNHSFNIHDYVVLMDAVPGRVNTVWFAPDKAGEHDIQCREYCGLIHYNMRGKLVVEDPIT